MPWIDRLSAPSGSSSNGKHSGSRGSGPEISVSHERRVGSTVRVTGPSKQNGVSVAKALGRPSDGTRPNDCL